jgi:hypothetical protein
MAERSSPTQRHFALIVKDEMIFALNLEAPICELGFDTCSLAANVG